MGRVKTDTNLSKKDYRSNLKPTWCQGCTNFGVLEALTRVLADQEVDPRQISIISGIGCSSRLPLWMNTFGLHSVHGRAIPIAIGARLARPDIPVIVTGGDGDLFSIGISHFVHAARKNIDITVICMDNRVYAMTKNQVSPTSKVGCKGTLTPYGKLSEPLNVIEFAISCKTTFVAQTFAANLNHMQEMFNQAISHRGFSFVNVISACLVCHKMETVKSYSKRLVDINKELRHDPADEPTSYAKASSSLRYHEDEQIRIPIGIFWKKQEIEPFEQKVARLKERYQDMKGPEQVGRPKRCVVNARTFL